MPPLEGTKTIKEARITGILSSANSVRVDSWKTMCAFVLIFFLFHGILRFSGANDAAGIPDERWAYVTVRADAHMFWWLYGADTEEPSERLSKPLIMWLQGGPGASSTGYGNFEELGPLTVNLTPRNTSWTRAANVLFVDNPVGSGFSYVTKESALTTNVSGKSEPVRATR